MHAHISFVTVQNSPAEKETTAQTANVNKLQQQATCLELTFIEF
jgi:hypothetical protein